MSSDWKLAYLMPHTGFKEAIEHGPLALVSPDDPRLLGIAAESEAVASLTSRFTDQFCKSIRPSAILIRSDALPDIDFYAVVCFRNAIAMASMIDAASFHLSGGRAGYPLWSDYFDFYAFTATPDGDLAARSLASMEINHPEQFSGQRAPHLASSERLSFGLDEGVLAGCLRQWDQRFAKNRPLWKTRVLFRSLEVACQASRVPAVGTRTPTIHDVGVGIALWVSAFEVLSHPKNGKANLKTVLDLLGSASWIDPQLKTKRFQVTYQGTVHPINWIQRFYVELYRARNDFLHGNPVAHGGLFPKKKSGGPTLLQIAPLIYRAALAAVLPGPSKRTSKGDLSSQLADFLVAQRVQSRYEKAVWRCRPGQKTR